MKRLFIALGMSALVFPMTLLSPTRAQEDVTPPPVVHSRDELMDYAQQHGPALDAASKAFTDQAVRDISRHWNLDTLKKYAHPKLMGAKPAEKWQKMFAMFSNKLGTLTHYQGSEGEAKLLVNPEGQIGITAHYLSAVTCEKASAKVRISLVRLGGAWQMTEFVVYSDAFFE